MSEKLPAPILIEDGYGMERLLKVLEGEGEIAFDTEADSFFHYREKVCLIQVTVAGEDYLIDPLADIDLSGLGPIFADPHKTKVFHDGEYDVLLMKRDFGFEFAGLFDTRIAAAALGETNPGLARVLNHYFGVELDKSMQRSDWSKRPLSSRQIEYARLDTRYLIDLMEMQQPELERMGRMPIHDGECRRVQALIPPENVFSPDEFVRIKGVAALDPIRRQCLRELYIWRDGEASRRDVSAFRVLNNQALLSLAEALPENSSHLENVPGVTYKQVRRHADALLDAIERAKDKGPLDQLPRQSRRNEDSSLDEREQEIHEHLKTWRKLRSQTEGYDSSLVLNRHVLLRLAKARPKTEAELDDIADLQDWQREAFGDQILKAIAEGERKPIKRRKKR